MCISELFWRERSKPQEPSLITTGVLVKDSEQKYPGINIQNIFAYKEEIY
jgi:hypothetical protein